MNSFFATDEVGSTQMNSESVPSAKSVAKKYPKDGIPDWPKTLRILNQAKLDGTNGPGVGHLCHQCREFVKEIWHTTFDKKRICPACCNTLGIGPQQDAERAEKFKQGTSNVQRPTSNIERKPLPLDVGSSTSDVQRSPSLIGGKQ